MIKRHLQLQIKKSLRQAPAVAILGPRQVGKTTLARTVSMSAKASTTYLDIENPRDQRKLQDAYTYLESLKNNLVLIDEVQLMPELFSILRPLIDSQRKPGRFILLGSASPHLVKGVAESLAGRITYLELTPIGLTELPSSIKMPRHWFYGGFPNALLARSRAGRKKWLDDFIRSYVERDLGHLFGVMLTPVRLRNFWTMLAHTNGNIWNAETFARSLGITAPTVLRYADYLEGGYMIRRLSPWFANVKKRLVKSPKIYFRDTGILHRMLNIENINELHGHPVIGASWEGYVIEQIYQCRPGDISLYFYRTHAGAECDLLLARGIKPIACIEIKLSNAPHTSKGFLNCIEDLKPEVSYLITPENDRYSTKHGITVIGLADFIKKELKKI